MKRVPVRRGPTGPEIYAAGAWWPVRVTARWQTGKRRYLRAVGGGRQWTLLYGPDGFYEIDHMCNRLATRPDDPFVRERFNARQWAERMERLEQTTLPAFNIAPTAPVRVITNAGVRRLEIHRWGLIPHWAKEPPRAPLTNARAESVWELPSFRVPVRTRRCLIPSTGYYEWRPEPGRKRPYHIRLPGSPLFAIAGIWDEWRAPDGEIIRSCALLTTVPAAPIAHIHDRMPVILRREDEGRWLDPWARRRDLEPLLTAYGGELEFYPVGKLVGDSPELVRPPTELGGLFAVAG